MNYNLQIKISLEVSRASNKSVKVLIDTLTEVKVKFKHLLKSLPALLTPESIQIT